MRAHCSFPVVRFPDPCVCFCVANGIKSFWHLLRVCMCVCVCSSFYALSPRSGGAHTHGAQHAIWLPCTRRSTRCGSFSMPISCRAYWMNRAPARLTDSAQTHSPSRSSASDQQQPELQQHLLPPLGKCCLHHFGDWHFEFCATRSQLPALLFRCLAAIDARQPATWILAWNCTADGTSFAFIMQLSRAISAEVARVPWLVLHHDAAENKKGNAKQKVKR